MNERHMVTEIVLGDLLGTGGFSNVHSIHQINLNSQSLNESHEYDRLARKDLSRTCVTILDPIYDDTINGKKSKNNSSFSKTSLQYSYVFKALKPNLPDSEHTKGMVDLAVEARLLSTLSHPHIITMRATADVDPLEHNFFVVLDRLQMTLDKQLKIWRQHVNKARGWKCFYFCSCSKIFLRGCCNRFTCANKHRLHSIWMERLTVAKNIALAMQYLHLKQIIYRDLKPDNVGFNKEGDVKIFDFGLAKRIHLEEKMDNDLYNLTGNTGSLRYMAPEVALGKPYDTRVDSYSFGILFWQLCSLTTPYSGYTCKMHADYVVKQGYRPQPDLTWQYSWTELMEDCWANDIFDRPNFDYIVSSLENEITLLCRDDGMVGNSPDALSQVKPKKKIKPVIAGELDEDTRISIMAKETEIV